MLPEELRSSVMSSLHDTMGHMGMERTLDLVRAQFYWPKMAADVEQKIRTCGRCVRRKSPPQKAAHLVNIQATRQLQLVIMDFLSLEPDRCYTRDILGITDFFTKFAVAVPTPNQKARTVAKCLWEHFIVHYGFPVRLHSDQGPNFESCTIKELCEISGIQKIRTSPFHPRGNPVERFNRTPLDMLGTLEEKDKSRWRDFVKPLVHAYNCAERNKIRFNKLVTNSSLEVNGHVLVRNLQLRGKHKLAEKWESEVYVVVKRAGDWLVYTVRPETRDGPLRTLHRDLLLPCGFLPASEVSSPTLTKPTSKPRTRRRPGIEPYDDDNSFSDPENEYSDRNSTVLFSS